jgi:hypothetical protein
MNKFLKVLLPPLSGFAIYFIVIRYSGQYFGLQLDEIGEGSLQGFMAYYRIFLPLLFVVALLTQLLIVRPAWDRALVMSTRSRIIELLSLFFICLVLAAAVSYPISSGHFYSYFLFFTIIQLIYWLINLTVLYLLSHTGKATAKTEDHKS